jgi:hypothetical protein
MAHFAELDSNNVVQRVIVVDNKDTKDANGVEKESIGVAFCEKLFGGTWKKTSYNGNIRGNFAGKGHTYFPDQDLFMPEKPYTSWNMATASATWVAPITEPTLTTEEANAGKWYTWDESAYQSDNTQGWVLNTPE